MARLDKFYIPPPIPENVKVPSLVKILLLAAGLGSINLDCKENKIPSYRWTKTQNNIEYAKRDSAGVIINSYKTEVIEENEEKEIYIIGYQSLKNPNISGGLVYDLRDPGFKNIKIPSIKDTIELNKEGYIRSIKKFKEESNSNF